MFNLNILALGNINRPKNVGIFVLDSARFFRACLHGFYDQVSVCVSVCEGPVTPIFLQDIKTEATFINPKFLIQCVFSGLGQLDVVTDSVNQ